METTLCDISAFAFGRIPPCIRRLILEEPGLSTRAERRSVFSRRSFLGYVPAPVHVMVTDRAELHAVRSFAYHLWTGDLPRAAIEEVDTYHSVTSPEMTLLFLARRFSLPHLVMAMYELTGTYSETVLTTEHRQEIQGMVDRGWRGEDGWAPVLDGGRMVTDLWVRPPLTTIDRLRAFAEEADGARGIRKFKRAISLLSGQAASPFEAKAAMLIGWPRRLGGYGMGPMELNREVRFDASARALTTRSAARVDIFLGSTEKLSALGVECQGRAVHGAGGVNEGDADRLLALQRGGLSMVLLSYRQLTDERGFQEAMRLIAGARGETLREKTPKMLQAERSLRYEVLQGWRDLSRKINSCAL